MIGDSGDDIGSIDIGPGTIDPSAFQAAPSAHEPEFYVAVLVMESTSDAAGYTPLYEESFILLTAESDAEAADKAVDHGRQLEISYQDEHHQPISWKLRRVVEVKRVEDSSFADGTELYSRFFRNYASYESIQPLLGEDT